MQPRRDIAIICRLQDCPSDRNRKTIGEHGSVLVALYRMGLISTQDGGKTFAYRRAA
jgi:hypothetical protein